MAQLLFGRWSDGLDPHVTGVDARRETSNRATLAGGVESLEEHDESRADLIGFQEAGGEQAQLGEAVLGFDDACVRLFLGERLGEVDLVNLAH